MSDDPNMPKDPFESVPLTSADMEGYLADQVDVQAGVYDTPIGKLPVLVFNFRNSAGGRPMPPIMFVATSAVTTNMVALVQKAADVAKKAAK